MALNQGVIAADNHYILIRCAEHHPKGFRRSFCEVCPKVQGIAIPVTSVTGSQ